MTPQEMIATIPFLALIISLIALLVNAHATERNAKTAVFVAQKHIDNALAVARRQIVSPIRQKWIDDLRTNVAEFISTAQAHWIYPSVDEIAHRGLLLVEMKVELMLNPKEPDHQELKVALNRLMEVVLRRKEERLLGDFTEALTQSTSLSQAVFKREWERVKNEI